MESVDKEPEQTLGDDGCHPERTDNCTASLDGVTTTESTAAVVDGLDSAETPEEIIERLKKEILKQNEDFGAKRAVFREMYMKQEEEYTKSKETINDLEVQVKRLQNELNEAKSQVTVANFSMENEIEMERQRRNKDLTSQRMKFEDAMQNMHMKHEMEMQQLASAKQKVESDLNEVRHLLSIGGNPDVGPGAMLSIVTKSLARKLNSTMSASSDSLHDVEEVAKVAKPGKYAHEDAETLRSLVIQLEEEVSALKEKLRHSDDQLGALQSVQASLVKGNDALTHILEGQDAQGFLTQIDERLREAMTGLEAEKSSRADLEMYVAFANAQKTLLQEELDKAKTTIKEQRQEYESTKKEYQELKETWAKANEHFVSEQNEYLEKISICEQKIRQLEAQSGNNNGTQSLTASSNATGESSGSVSSTEMKVKCSECEKNALSAEKMRNDLHKAAKLRNEMEEEWSRISNEFQNKLGTLEEKVATYDVILLEVNTSCQQSTEEMETFVKNLQYDRETIQRKIERLETENDSLKGKHVAHSRQLQNESINLPDNVMELHEKVLKLLEELISVKVGKEQIEGDLKFLKDQMQMIEDEKSSIEDSLNSEIVSYREKINQLQNTVGKYEEDKKRYEKQITDLKNKVLASETQIGKLHHIKEQNKELVKEKEKLVNDIQELNGKVGTLRRELTNSEELQKDLIALSKSLQVNLETLRQAETEVRWQYADDVSQCNTCKKTFPDSKEKHHCKHCGRIFCTGCVCRTVRRGNRDYNVCGVCHTLLAHDSAPYFSTEPPHSPD